MDRARPDPGLSPEQVIRHAGPIITARVVRFEPSYTREIKVGQPVLVAVLVAAGLAAAIGSLILSALRTGSGARTSRRRLRDLRKGPEFLVTPIRLRDDFGQAYEVEMHGQLPQSALHRGDLVQVTTRPQKDPRLPVRMQHVVNLTTLQMLTPRIPTLWSHLGPSLLLQATFGLLVAGAVAIMWAR
ncbi:MAG TPA: hypothetical protein VFO77_14030 [Actinoplanes sp.]|nr:hypothetical protein [Actinoplanes sp.]